MAPSPQIPDQRLQVEPNGLTARFGVGAAPVEPRTPVFMVLVLLWTLVSTLAAPALVGDWPRAVGLWIGFPLLGALFAAFWRRRAEVQQAFDGAASKPVDALLAPVHGAISEHCFYVLRCDATEGATLAVTPAVRGVEAIPWQDLVVADAHTVTVRTVDGAERWLSTREWDASELQAFLERWKALSAAEGPRRQSSAEAPRVRAPSAGREAANLP